MLGRKIEYVILHYPCRADQDRFGDDIRRRRLVLDQFDQVIAIDDAAGRHRDLLTDAELRRRRRLRQRRHTLTVVEPILPPAHQIGATLLKRAAHDPRIEPGDVRWRYGIKPLLRHEGGARGVLRLHAADGPRCGLPPSLLREEGLPPPP